MDQLIHNSCFFSSYLKISYDKRFITTAIDMVKSLAKLSGANEREILHLTMLVEDSLVFIIDKYIDDKLKAHIEIGYMLFDDNKVVLEFSDMGTPIHKDQIPEFNINNNDSIDGLWLHMVQQISDKFEIVNLLNKGWVIRVEKIIEKLCFEMDSTNNFDNPEISKSKPLLRLATAEDADSLIDLAFMTYRYSNAIPEFYDIKLLKEHINESLYDIIIAEVDGQLIGATNVKYSKTNDKFAELSGAMVHPDYRKTTVVMHLLREITKYHKKNPRGIDFFVSHIVTTHSRSQKAAERIHNGYHPLSIFLNMIPRPNYIGIKDVIGRESQLNSFHINRALTIEKIYSPADHAVIIDELIKNTGNFICISTEPGVLTADKTELTTLDFKFASSGMIIIQEMGKDWFQKTCKIMLKLTAAGDKTIVLNLPSDKPLPADLDENLTGLNMFFCGLTLNSLDDIQLSYAFTSEPVDFSLVELYNPVAMKLLDHIEKHYKTMNL